MDKSLEVLERTAMASIIEQRRARRWKMGFRFATLAVVAAIFTATQVSNADLGAAGASHTAVVAVRGEISDQSMASAQNVNKALRKAFEAPNAAGVVLYINSPGGSPVQSGQIADEIRRLRKENPEKHLYAVIGDMGASGGYYIASAAEKIYADRASLVGSIGVTAATFGFVDLMAKVGVERRAYTSGEHKSFLDPFQPQNTDETNFWQTVLADTHQQFIESVKSGRGDRLDLSQENQLFSGLIWTGRQAKGLGLIDEFGTVESVARNDFKAAEIVDYTVAENRFDVFARKLGASVGVSLLQNLASVSAGGQPQLR